MEREREQRELNTRSEEGGADTFERQEMLQPGTTVMSEGERDGGRRRGRHAEHRGRRQIDESEVKVLWSCGK